MKNTLIAILTITTVALGATSIVQWRKLSERQEQLSTLQAEATQQNQRVTDAESAAQLAESQREEAQAQAGRLATKIQTIKPVAATVRATNANGSAAADDGAEKAAAKDKDKNPFGYLAKMMDDPNMKKMMREQQRTIMNQLYGPLVKQMNLSPED